MSFIRPAKKDDLDRIIDFAMKAELGITSLPRNEKVLENRLLGSLSSFNKTVNEPGNERYYFVLEDPETNKIMGLSGIKANTTVDHPLVTYKIEDDGNFFWLIPTIHTNALTEIASLYLSPDFRKRGAGRLLSFSRFLFMSAFPHRFNETIFANLRGMISDKGDSPFWNNVTGRFHNHSFKELMRRLDNDILDYKHLLPNHPLCTLFLDSEITKVLGKTDTQTLPAFEMLKEEGFEFLNEIDVMDGGPILYADLKKIKTNQHALLKRLTRFADEGSASFVSNLSLDFRATITGVQITGREAALPKEAAEILKVNLGDDLLISPIHFEKK